MHLAIAIAILIIWAAIILKDKMSPRTPPIDDLDAHLKEITSLKDAKERQKYLKNKAKDREK